MQPSPSVADPNCDSMSPHHPQDEHQTVGNSPQCCSSPTLNQTYPFEVFEANDFRVLNRSASRDSTSGHCEFTNHCADLFLGNCFPSCVYQFYQWDFSNYRPLTCLVFLLTRFKTIASWLWNDPAPVLSDEFSLFSLGTVGCVFLSSSVTNEWISLWWWFVFYRIYYIQCT